MYKQVVRYFGDSYDWPIGFDWWVSRVTDLQGYVAFIKRNREPKPGGCMGPGKYPFDVHRFMDDFDMGRFIDTVIQQLMIQYKSTDHMFREYIRESMKSSFKEHEKEMIKAFPNSHKRSYLQSQYEQLKLF